MAVPDGLTDDKLAQNGFTKISDREAKHGPSHRWRCDNCGDWFKQLESRQGKMLCRKCRKKERERR
jgi:hypothetical protein